MEQKQKSAYASRESLSTRNPHSAKAPANINFSKLSPEERIVAQWRSSSGCPISDEAKAQFRIEVLGKTFNLADVRIWGEMQSSSKDTQAIIYLEFFFDGSPDELGDQREVFTQAFEKMIEQQLQEQRVAEFRRKLATRRRNARGGSGEDGESAEDDEWRSYLKKPAAATNLSIRSLREAGCMLRFLVCQTSLSLSASEVLGQIAFQEHFPIDGIAQEPSKSTKPLPRWVYYLGAATAGMSVLTLTAWYHVLKQAAFSGAAVVAEAAAIA